MAPPAVAPLTLDWRETTFGYRADLGAFSALAVNDWAYSAVNGTECFMAAVAFRPGPGRPALTVARSDKSPRELAAAKVTAEALLRVIVPVVQEAFLGLLPGELLQAPGVGIGAPADAPVAPRKGPAPGGCWLELD